MSDVFELSSSDITQSEKFRFKLPGEKRIYEVPNLNRLPVGVRMGLSEAAKPLAEAQKRKREPKPEDVAAAAGGRGGGLGGGGGGRLGSGETFG